MIKYLIKKWAKFTRPKPALPTLRRVRQNALAFGRITIAMIVFLLGFVFLGEDAVGIANPSAVYCQELGYEWTIKKTEEGEIGICEFPDGSSCSAWEFLKGRCGQEYSYCHQKDYQLKTIFDNKKCAPVLSKDCSVCVLAEDIEVDVSTLMKLEKEVPSGFRCGDEICYPFSENRGNCPQDCPSGRRDNYCDKEKDGTCDPDCEITQDPDCEKEAAERAFIYKIFLILIIILIIIVVATVSILIYRRIKKRKLLN